MLKFDVSIDNIRAVIKVPKNFRLKALGFELNPFNDLWNFCHAYGKYNIKDTGEYPRQFHFPFNLGMIAFPNDNSERVLWDFNPNKLDFIKDRISIYEELREILQHCRFSHFTRRDIAVDVDMSINDNHFNYKGSRKEVLYKNNGKIETMYKGSRQSEIQFRIYDKDRDAQVKGYDLPPHMLSYVNKTRIELEYKSKEKLTTEELTKIFSRLSVVSKSNVLEELDKHCKPMIANGLAYIIENDRYDRLELVSKNSKSKYKQIIKKVDNCQLSTTLNMFKFDNVTEQLDKFEETLSIYEFYTEPF